ncbi:hypothetical protein TRIUR3_21901 [Triticum urartu]|uniref:Uncharacterized protein n=1 Tax=Triticum urartu TaxID=4572 RepID=M7YUD0_TRIUA|nr:hypothetical protein TRIUR3_21901 [Triticum urartu]
MEKLRPAVLLLLFFIGVQFPCVSPPTVYADAAGRADLASAHTPKDTNFPAPNRKCTCEIESFCTPSTELAKAVPWIAFILSSGVSLVPAIRVGKLGPDDQGGCHTLFWWFLIFNLWGYIMWNVYTESCNRFDPIRVASFIGAAISFVLFVKAYKKLPKRGVDLRLYNTFHTVFGFLLFTAVVRTQAGLLGWSCLGVTVVAHFFRISATKPTSEHEKRVKPPALSFRLNDSGPSPPRFQVIHRGRHGYFIQLRPKQGTMPHLPGEAALHEFMVGVVFLLVTKVAHIHLILKISPSPSIRLPDAVLQRELDEDLTV